MEVDFSGLIREGDRVVCGQATAEPVTLTEALVAQAGHLPAFRMMVGPIFSDTFSAACARAISSERIDGSMPVTANPISASSSVSKPPPHPTSSARALCGSIWSCVSVRLKYGTRHGFSVV